ncbi:MAG: RelA/SpoT family protein, partial [Bacteroidales bacterium]
EITNSLKATKKDRDELVSRFIMPLRDKLNAEGIKYTLKVRTKTAYSIWKKMQVHQVPFENVYDVFAIRFIIDSPPDKEKELCWTVY